MKTPKLPSKLYIITPDGSETRLCKDSKASLAELQAAVGGLIEAVKVKFQGATCTGYVNEEGLMHRLPLNRAASRMSGNYWNPRKRTGQVLVGNLVIEARPGTKLYDIPVPAIKAAP